MSVMPPNEPCICCGCRPHDVLNSLEIARVNIKLTERIEQLEKALSVIAEDHPGLRDWITELSSADNQVEKK